MQIEVLSKGVCSRDGGSVRILVAARRHSHIRRRIGTTVVAREDSHSSSVAEAQKEGKRSTLSIPGYKKTWNTLYI